MKLNNLNKVIDKIKSAKLETQPFPHLLIKDFIPRSLFLNFADALPNYNDLNGENVFTQANLKQKNPYFMNLIYLKKYILKTNILRKLF